MSTSSEATGISWEATPIVEQYRFVRPLSLNIKSVTSTDSKGGYFKCKVNGHSLNDSEWVVKLEGKRAGPPDQTKYIDSITVNVTSNDQNLSIEKLETADISVTFLDPNGEDFVKSEGIQSKFTKCDEVWKWRHVYEGIMMPVLDLNLFKLVFEFRYLERKLVNISDEQKECALELYDYLGPLGSKRNDVTLCCVGEAQFHAHKMVLSARSPKFAEIFDWTKDKKIEITDVTPKVMKEMLAFIYTGKAPNMDYDDDMTKDLLVAADCYKMDKLKAMAERNLVSKLSIDNAIDFLILAETNDADELVNKSSKFIGTNFRDVMKTENWCQMVQKKPRVVDRIMESVSAAMAGLTLRGIQPQ